MAKKVKGHKSAATVQVEETSSDSIRIEDNRPDTS
jgi:hypothetical protein